MNFKAFYFIAVITGLIFFVSVLVITIVNNNDDNPSKHENSFDLKIIPRDEWIAQPPTEPLTDLELPIDRVIIANTATENCSTQAECTFRVRFIQTVHIALRHWSDIGYNFLVGGDGSIYEGRGWKKEGAHTKGFNKKSICFAFIGKFNTDLPPTHQIEVAKKMIAAGVELGVLSQNYKLYGHRQLVPLESPGAKLFENIKTWDHWSAVVD